MARSKPVLLPALTLSILVVLALAAPSGAAAARFGCLARAVTGTPFSSPGTFDPTTVTDTPCKGSAKTRAGSATFGPVRIGAAGAFAHASGHREAPGASTLASLTDFQLSVPGEQIAIQTAQAQSSLACSSGALQGISSSEVSGVRINGQAVSLPDGSVTTEIKLDSHGSYLLLNKQTQTSSELSRTAAFVHLLGVGDYTIAEALVNNGVRPCAKATGFAPSVHACPPGSSYEPTSQNCLITAFTKRPISIAAPFRGPTGVTVASLVRARSVANGARCLRGAGPSYAMIGSANAGGLIEGTRGADRIVTLSGTFTIEGNGGKDCIATGRGTNLIHDGSAKLRIYGGSGLNEITVGNGNDRIFLGAGTNVVHAGNGRDYIRGAPGFDTIFVGNGNDTVLAGAGFNIVSAGNGNDRIVAGPGIGRISAGRGRDVIQSGLGFDRISATGAGARVSCVDRAQVVVNPAAVAYARAHHCTNVVAR